MYRLCAGSRFRCKIVCGDVFSSASDALFSVMYFYMTMVCLFYFIFLLFYPIVATVTIKKALCYCQFIAIKYIQCIFPFSFQPQAFCSNWKLKQSNQSSSQQPWCTKVSPAPSSYALTVNSRLMPRSRVLLSRREFSTSELLNNVRVYLPCVFSLVCVCVFECRREKDWVSMSADKWCLEGLLQVNQALFWQPQQITSRHS